MADRRLSLVGTTYTCDHTCCQADGNWGHNEPGHLHLFSTADCPDCAADRHPSAAPRDS